LRAHAAFIAQLRDEKLEASAVSAYIQTLLNDVDPTAAQITLDVPSVARMNTVPVNLVGLAVGECFTTTAGFTVPTGLVVGGTYVICNDSSVSITITQGAGLTLRLSGTVLNGNWILAPRGMASIWVRSSSVYYISGPLS
jgi:hypothetical protein